MKIIFFVILFITANVASAQIPRDVHREPTRDKVSRDIIYEKGGRSDKFQEIPFRNDQEIPGLIDIYMTEILSQIRKCKYNREDILSRLELLEKKCTDPKARHGCIIAARRKCLETLIDNCNK